MGIQSLGVGSGLDLNGLVTQLLEAERAPKMARLDKREEELEAVISGVGQLKSKLDEFKDSVDELRNSYDLQGRKAIPSHPGVDEEGEGPFTAEASNSATQGTYEITIEQMAKGSRVQTADDMFADSSAIVNSGADSQLTFEVDGAGESFAINVTSGMTLQQLRAAVNNDPNNFGVNASIIDTGVSGAKLVFNSEITGADNSLKIINDTNNADLNLIATHEADGTTATTSVITDAAQNARAYIDGIEVESDTNEFENVIQNVSFEASKLSEVDYIDNSDPNPDNAFVVYKKSTLEIGADKDGVKNKITDFVDNYNTLMSEIDTLTKYGTSELEDDGALAGDYMTRGIESGLSSILSQSVSPSGLGTLFQIGISFDDKGKLQITDTDDLGFGSGQDLLDDALEDNYDDIAALFSDDDEGIANKLYDFVYQYTTFGGLLKTREQSMKDKKELLFDERARVELQMAGHEQLLRDKYTNLDLTVAKLNRTGGALSASLGML
jgi:flagellar hook-associated protein 2